MTVGDQPMVDRKIEKKGSSMPYFFEPFFMISHWHPLPLTVHHCSPSAVCCHRMLQVHRPLATILPPLFSQIKKGRRREEEKKEEEKKKKKERRKERRKEIRKEIKKTIL